MNKSNEFINFCKKINENEPKAMDISKKIIYNYISFGLNEIENSLDIILGDRNNIQSILNIVRSFEPMVVLYKFSDLESKMVDLRDKLLNMSRESI